MWPNKVPRKESFVVFFAETEHQKFKNGKKSGKTFRFGFLSQKLTHHMAIYLSAHTWSTILCPHRWRTCYGCYISDPKDSKIASFMRPAWWCPGNGKHISHLLLEPRRKSSYGGLPQFQETRVSRMLHESFCWSMSQLCSHSWLKDGNRNPLSDELFDLLRRCIAYINK